MQFRSTSPNHLLDKRANPFRFNAWVVVVPLGMVSLAGLIVLGLMSFIPEPEPAPGATGAAPPPAQASKAGETDALRESMMKLRLAGLLYAKDHEGQMPASVTELTGTYIDAIPAIPKSIVGKPAESAWSFVANAVHLTGISNSACDLINNGARYSRERDDSSFYCFSKNDQHTAVVQKASLSTPTKGYRLVTATFNLDTIEAASVVNLQLTGERDSFVAACPPGAHLAPSTNHRSIWLDNQRGAPQKYVEQFCIPTTEANPDELRKGTSATKGVNSLSNIISTPNDEWTLFISGYAIPGCLSPPDRVSIVYTTGAVKGKASKALLPRGCLPEFERQL
jgi:hypothetical protein